MKRILFSAMAVVLSLGLMGGAFAFFSDVETSAGNTFTAGKLDLKVDLKGSTHWRTQYDADGEGSDVQVGDPIAFGMTDLTNEVFFNWSDIKPGDWGEATISLHVYDNDAWARVLFTMTANDDNGLTEPERSDDATSGQGEGDLADNLLIMFWLDEGTTDGWQGNGSDSEEGDNIYQSGEPVLVPEYSLSEILSWPSYGSESDDNFIWMELPGVTSELGDEWLTASETIYIGIAWRVDGEVGNIIQSDSVAVTVSFEVEQKANQFYPWGS